MLDCGSVPPTALGLNPERLAAAIHQQLGDSDKPVPVEQIATALDIDEIREEHLTNLEAALITTRERGYGKILLNKNSGRQRQRFSLAHELLHFLNPIHVQTADESFFCSRSDMRATIADTDRHSRQEVEANTFIAPIARCEMLYSCMKRIDGAMFVERMRNFIKTHVT